LRAGGHRADFDKAKTQGPPGPDVPRIFVHPCRQAHAVGKRQTHHLDRLGTPRRTQKPRPPYRFQAGQSQSVGHLGRQQKEKRTHQPVKHHLPAIEYPPARCKHARTGRFFLFFLLPHDDDLWLISRSYNSGDWSGSLYGKTSIFSLWVETEVAPPALEGGLVHPSAVRAGASERPAWPTGNQTYRHPTMHRFPDDRRREAFLS
jgi:hypothetical protein